MDLKEAVANATQEDSTIRAFARIVAEELKPEDLQLISGAGYNGRIGPKLGASYTDSGNECDPDPEG